MVPHRLPVWRTGGLHLGRRPGGVRGPGPPGGAGPDPGIRHLRPADLQQLPAAAEHLSDPRCNRLCRLLAESPGPQNGVIVHSDLLLDHLRRTYPGLYFVSSTTKVLTDFSLLRRELERPEFRYVVADFRLNRAFRQLDTLPQALRDKTELLCNECCAFGCRDRAACYRSVSRENLGLEGPVHRCTAPDAAGGYRFSRAMENPGFIGVNDIRDVYLPMGFSQFKIEGRSLGTALLLEFLLHYLTRPEYHIHVREALYLDNTLDLF